MYRHRLITWHAGIGQNGIGGDPIGESSHTESSFRSWDLSGRWWSRTTPPCPPLTILLPPSSPVREVPFFFSLLPVLWVRPFFPRSEDHRRKIDAEREETDGRRKKKGRAVIGKERSRATEPRVIEEETPPRHPHSKLEREAILPLVQGKIG